MINVAIVKPTADEPAPTLNGRKKWITQADFIAAGISMWLFPVTVNRMIGMPTRLLPLIEEMIDNSMLDGGIKRRCRELLRERLAPGLPHSNP